MKKIAIQGALNVDNFGDVLLGRIYSDWLSQCGCQVYAPKAKQTVLDEMPNACRGDFSSADALAYIGGGYFGEPPRRFLGKYRWGFRMMRYHLSASIPFILKRKPISITGVGVGPVTNFIAWLGVALVSRLAKLVVVRDTVSRDYLVSHWGSKNVYVAPDVALTVSRNNFSQKMKKAADELYTKLPNKEIIALHYDQQAATDEQWQLLWNETLNWLEGKDAHILLLTDQKNTPVIEAQMAEYAQYQSLIKNSSIYTYDSVDHLIGTLSSCSIILTTKLHVAIVGTALEVPAYALACHTKTQRFFNQLNMYDLCLSMNEWTPSSLCKVFNKADNKEMPNKKELAKKKALAQSGLDKLQQFANKL